MDGLTTLNHGDVQLAEKVLAKMELKGVAPDEKTFGSLVKAYARGRDPAGAEAVLDRMRRYDAPSSSRGGGGKNSNNNNNNKSNKGNNKDNNNNNNRQKKLKPGVVLYSTVVSGYSAIGDMAEAKRVVTEMSAARVSPNERTFGHLVWGYGQLGDVAGITSTAQMMMDEGVSLRMGGEGRKALVRACRECGLPATHVDRLVDSLTPNPNSKRRRRQTAGGENFSNAGNSSSSSNSSSNNNTNKAAAGGGDAGAGAGARVGGKGAKRWERSKTTKGQQQAAAGGVPKKDGGGGGSGENRNKDRNGVAAANDGGGGGRGASVSGSRDGGGWGASAGGAGGGGGGGWGDNRGGGNGDAGRSQRRRRGGSTGGPAMAACYVAPAPFPRSVRVRVAAAGLSATRRLGGGCASSSSPAFLSSRLTSARGLSAAAAAGLAGVGAASRLLFV